jgi:hypothetical protein
MQVARNSAGVSWLIGFRRQSGHPDTKAESRAAERAIDEVHEALEALLLTPLLPPLLTPAGGAPLRAPMPEEGGDASPRASLTEKFDDVARRLQICVQLLAERCAQELELATVLYLCWEGAARQAALSRSWRCECHACVALCAGLRGAACAGSVPGRDCFPKQLHGPIGTAAVNTALLASPGGSAARRGPEEQARWHLWQPPYTLLNITLTDRGGRSRSRRRRITSLSRSPVCSPCLRCTRARRAGRQVAWVVPPRPASTKPARSLRTPRAVAGWAAAAEELRRSEPAGDGSGLLLQGRGRPTLGLPLP